MILYIFSSFSYRIYEDTLSLQWRILKYIPFGFHKIKLIDIQEARRFKLRDDLLSGAYIFGNLFTKRGVILILKRRHFFMKKILITPDDPDTFIEKFSHIKAA
jgi:hypothetical protein